MKSKKPFLNMDERSRQIAHKIMAVMYLLTIFALQVIIIYRQLALGQELGDFEDFAIVMTVNSLFLVSALLYFGAVQIRKLSMKAIAVIYVVIVTAGAVFTYAKYNIFQSPGLSAAQIFDKLIVIAAIVGLIMGFWILLSYLGKRKIEKELE